MKLTREFMGESLIQLVEEVKKCRICEPYLVDGVRPIVQLSSSAKILIAGQAPGRKVHETGKPFNDASGDRLRSWMSITQTDFYNPEKVAILPMAFCFPGTGKSGDLPPRKECATQWREALLEGLPNLKLILVIGKYAQDYHLENKGKSLTETVAAWESFDESVMPLPHPSPRNNIWLRRNDWFEKDVLPELKVRVERALQD